MIDKGFAQGAGGFESPCLPSNLFPLGSRPIWSLFDLEPRVVGCTRCSLWLRPTHEWLQRPVVN